MKRNINSKKNVIKIGTNVITNEEGALNLNLMRKLIAQIAKIRDKGKDILIITSGAIGAGMQELHLKARPRDVIARQVCAAIGQSILMTSYQSLFNKHNIKVAQILLTYNDFSNRKTYLNLRNSLNNLLKLGVVPIINENDPISINEIGPSFGDNDMLSSMVASEIEADLLIILTNVEGLFDRNPKDRKAKLLREVFEIDKNIEKISGKASHLGLGGMQTKVKAAKMAMQSGAYVIIANGKANNVLLNIIDNKEVGTIFYPKQKLSNKKRWIMQSKSNGKICIDKGAKESLLNGKNLLPAGVTNVEGQFNLGDIVDIICEGNLFARCICDYSSIDLDKVKGKNSKDILKIFGNSFHKNIFKRENLVFV